MNYFLPIAECNYRYSFTVVTLIGANWYANWPVQTQVEGDVLTGRCRRADELVQSPILIQCTLPVIGCRTIFGYRIRIQRGSKNFSASKATPLG